MFWGRSITPAILLLLEITCCRQFHSSLALSPIEISSNNAAVGNSLTISRGARDASNDTQIRGNMSASTSNDGGKKNTLALEGTMIIPEKPQDANYTKKTPSHNEEKFDNEDFTSNGDPSGQPKFDENAVERALIVVAVLALGVLGYLGAKFMLTKKKKVDKRYGRIEASEIDLLDEMEEAETDEEEELFDVNMTRRSF